MGDLGMTYTSDKWATERIADLEEAGIAITSKYDEAKARIAELEDERNKQMTSWHNMMARALAAEAKLAALEKQEPVAEVVADNSGYVLMRFTKYPLPKVETKLYTSAPPAVPDNVVKDAERYRFLRQKYAAGELTYIAESINSEEQLDALLDAEKEQA